MPHVFPSLGYGARALQFRPPPLCNRDVLTTFRLTPTSLQ